MAEVSREYFSDFEAVGTASNLTTPGADLPFYTPRASVSRRSSRRSSNRDGSSSPAIVPNSSSSFVKGLSPELLLPDDDEDAHLNGDVSPFDPRRFTPTLHASLVSEILTLRRELESKTQFIEELEAHLTSSKSEKDELSERLAKTDKERRTLKRQVQQVEHGSLAALEELSKDRDTAKSFAEELKVKLDASQKRLKSSEDDAQRLRNLWETDKHCWETERRNLERKVHISETRLKSVFDEIAVRHAPLVGVEATQVLHEDVDSHKDSGIGEESDTASILSRPRSRSPKRRHTRMSSKNSIQNVPGYRASIQSLAGEFHKSNDVSLADELLLDEEDEISDEDIDMPRAESTPSPAVTAEYVNSAVQYSPPPSPVLEAKSKHKIIIPEIFKQHQEVEANQRRKRTSHAAPPSATEKGQMSPTAADYKPVDKPCESCGRSGADRSETLSPADETSSPTTKCASVQTVETPISPPATPKLSTPSSPTEVWPNDPSAPPLPQRMASTSTQTDVSEPANVGPRSVAPSTIPNGIPSIVIEPPVSAPSSPKEALLPANTRSASSQTTADLVPTVSTSVQTEEIRLNKNLLAKLPAHLQPSAISSAPASPEASRRRSGSEISPLKDLLKAAQDSMEESSRLRSRSSWSQSPDFMHSSPPSVLSSDVEDRYPGNNDNGPLNGSVSTNMRRPFRNSSLFAGFTDQQDPSSSQNDDSFRGSVLSTPAASHRSSKQPRFRGNRPSPVPEEKEVKTNSRSFDSFDFGLPSSLRFSTTLSTARHSSEQLDTQYSNAKGGNLSRNTSIRRSALIQNGANAHSQRSRASSNASAGSSAVSGYPDGPPFAIPDRGSSRRLFSQTKSEGSRSPTPRSGGFFSSGRRAARQGGQKEGLRKVRSATAIQNQSRIQNRSRSPALPTKLTSPSLGSLTEDQASTSQIDLPRQDEGSRETARSSGFADIGRASQGSVVDAIAACMVGEWMFKYVRRRKSFGVQDSPNDQFGRPGTDGSVNVTGNGVRHRRWVWLSPYERSIMWSSKQPQSNSALMGKTGRKLTIQSVLDVRDDTPLPRNHGVAEPFHRSILILTPARALKFTALTLERHHTWLTALSFLAHSPMLAAGLDSIPKSSHELAEDDQESVGAPAPSLRRFKLTDSVRSSRSKSRTPINRNITVPAALRSSKDGADSSAPSPNVPTFPRWTASSNDPGPSLAIENNSNNTAGIDSAEPPSVPRFSHGRKRSMTSPSLLSGSWSRSLAYTTVPTPSYLTSPPAVQVYQPSDHNTSADTIAMAFSTHPNGATPSPSHLTGSSVSFHQGAEGTIRMDAFVEAEPSPSFEAEEMVMESRMQENPLGMNPARGADSAAIPPLPTGAASIINKAMKGRRISSAQHSSNNSIVGGDALGPLEQHKVMGGSGAVPTMRGSRVVSGAGGGNDARRSGIVYPDDFDAFDPFRGSG